SRRKSILIFKNLIEQGFSREQIERVHAPIGLNIGALTPEELAVSIMGEIIKQRRGGDGTSLTMDKGQLETALQKEKAV
ncbi:XdhC/CoxF family protein, partial [candidate division KSB1 bacterium]|nr:XdhC/CoxF family protein [candidate division KSB1 bacterium]NIT69332.1 XdhC/CoxF family protein [candidate division KSB1 bacterium]NIW67358.1 xanthine dehydrogenase [candidate division KSB1 bacterium]NIX69013.1 xanthine dehydrogenase [candidate division KSB1 bacterium]